MVESTSNSGAVMKPRGGQISSLDVYHEQSFIFWLYV